MTLGKEMKILFQTFILTVIALTGCSERNDVVWNGSEGFTFNGVELELPKSGKGDYSVTHMELRYEWDGNILTIKDLGDENVSVTTQTVKGQVVKKSRVIIFDDAGKLSTRPADTESNKKPNKSEQATPRKPSD